MIKSLLEKLFSKPGVQEWAKNADYLRKNVPTSIFAEEEMSKLCSNINNYF